MTSDFGQPKLRGLSLPPAPRPMSFGTRIASPSGIRFSHLRFSDPTPFDTAYRQSCGGVYVIMVSDHQWGPRQYRPLYFGKASNFAERVCRSHEKYADWVRASGGSLLFLAFHFATLEHERTTAEQTLIRDYKPQCNVRLNALAAFYGR
jgi:hypothetical protein